MTARKRKPKRVTTSVAWVEYGPAALWMHLYAQWLAAEPEAELTAAKGERVKRGHWPTSLQRQAKASALARKRIDRRIIVLLERRDDFRAYFEKLRVDAQFQAQELARRDIAENIEIRREGLFKAADRQVGDDGTVTYGDGIDHKSVEMYTRWTRELAFPKKLEREAPPTRITIHIEDPVLRAKTIAIMNGTDIEEPIEWEGIPNDRLLEAGEDD